MKQKVKNNGMLMLTALIWGSAFVAQSAGMAYVGPFTFNSLRCLLGALVLLPVIWILGRKEKSVQGPHTEEKKGDRKTLWIGGICCGIALAVGSSLQQVGLLYTSAGKAGFLTALYILVVPLLGVFVGKRAGIKIWAGVGLALVGIYFLCVKEGFSIVQGDLLMIVSAFVFAIHILVIDYFAPKVDGVKMSCIQFLVCGVLCAVPMVIWERPAAGAVLDAYVPLLYAGVLSCGLAYTMQVVAQKDAEPTVASLILSLESVFAALTSWLILHEKRTPRELFGCALVFLAIILAQLPSKNLRAEKSLKGEAASEINKETEQFETP